MPEDNLLIADPKVREALRKARELEKNHLSSSEETVSMYKRGIAASEELKKLLRTAWFIKDTEHEPKKKSPRRATSKIDRP